MPPAHYLTEISISAMPTVVEPCRLGSDRPYPPTPSVPLQIPASSLSSPYIKSEILQGTGSYDSQAQTFLAGLLSHS